MFDIWSKLFDLVLKHWKQRPRKQVIASVVGLRDSMVACQSWYERYISEESGRKKRLPRLKQKSPSPRDEWAKAVRKLGEAIENIGIVLPIFSPEATKNIGSY